MRTLTTALILAIALAGTTIPSSVSADEPVFRWRTSGVGIAPDTPTDPETDPVGAASVKAMRATFGFADGGVLRNVEFGRGGTRQAAESWKVSGGDEQAAGAIFAPSGGSWSVSGSSAVVTYFLADGAFPDRLDVAAANGSGPVSVLIEESADGVGFRPVVAYSDEPAWAAGERRRYPFVAGAEPPPAGEGRKFWRLAVDTWNTDGFTMGLEEMTFLDARGVDVTVGGTIRTDYVSNALIGRAVDKSASTGWMGQHMDTRPVSFSYEFPQPVAVASMDLVGGSRAAQSFRIESSQDGRTWRPEARYRGQTAWERGERRNYPIGFAKPSAGHYQFWRVRSIVGNRADGTMGLNDLMLFASDGSRADAKSVISASSQFSSSSRPLYAADGANSNDWIAAAGDLGAWIGYTLPEPRRVTSVAIHAEGATSPRTFVIEGSNDGEAWDILGEHFGQGSWTRYERRDFPVERAAPAPRGHHRFWRMAVERNGNPLDYGVTVREMAFLANGASLTSKGVPLSDSVSKTPAGGFDGAFGSSVTGVWSSTTPSGWLGYEFNYPVLPDAVRIHASGWTAPADFGIEWSDDGVTWTSVARHMAHAGWTNEGRILPMATPTLATGTHRYWRVLVKATTGDVEPEIAEVSFAGPGGQAPSSAPLPMGSTRSATNGSFERAFDNNAATMWSAAAEEAGKGTAWIGAGYSSGLAASSVSVTTRGNTQGVPRRPIAIAIQASQDARTWTTMADYDAIGNWGSGQTKVFPIPRPAPTAERSDRLRVKVSTALASSGATNWTGPALLISDIFLTDPSGAPITADGLVHPGGQAGYHADAQRAFDGLSTTAWTPAGSPSSIDFEIHLPLPQAVGDFFPDMSPGCACDLRVVLERLVGASWQEVGFKEFKHEMLVNGRTKRP